MGAPAPTSERAVPTVLEGKPALACLPPPQHQVKDKVKVKASQLGESLSSPQPTNRKWACMQQALGFAHPLPQIRRALCCELHTASGRVTRSSERLHASS